MLIEKKSRRIEISLYCLARAIESFFTWMTDAGLCPPILLIKRADVVVFSYLYHYALLCAGKRSLPVQVPECAGLGIWCAATT